MALGALAERLRETGALLAAQAGRAFTLHADEALAVVQADEQLVERVFDNAMQNALRYASSRVEAHLTAAGGRLVLTVRDDGCGFSEVDVPGPSQGHFGLQGIRERIGNSTGLMEIESTPGKGTKVTVSFLADEKDEDET